jgi:chromosome segregation ATPase
LKEEKIKHTTEKRELNTQAEKS